MFLPILAGLGIAGGAAAVGEHGAKVRRAQEAAAAEALLLQKKGEALAKEGNWEGYESIIPHLQRAGASENIIDAGRQLSQTQARQIYEQEVSSGLPPSVKPPPNYLAAIMQSQQPVTGPSPEPATGPTSMAQDLPALGERINALGEQTRALPLGERGPLVAERGRLINEEARLSAQPFPVTAPSSQPTAPAQTGIVFPPVRPPTSRTIQGPVGSSTISLPGTSGKDVTANVIAQARTQQMPPRQLQAAMDVENTRRRLANQPALDPDDPAMKTYADEHFESVVNRIRPNLEAQGMDPGTAMQQAAKKAYDETGILPEKWKSIIEPKEGQLSGNAYISAITRAGEALPKQLEILRNAKSPEAMKGAIAPGFLSRLIDSTPNLKPEDVVRAKHTAAESLSQRLMPQLTQQFPNRTGPQYSAMAMQLAAYATDGEVPREWYQAVAGDPQAFGFSAAQSEIMAAMQINPFEPGAGQRAQDAKSALDLRQDVQKRLLATTQTPEGVAAMGAQLQGKAPAAAAPGAAPGPLDRSIQLQQKGAVEEQQKTIERKYAVAPPGEMDKLKPLDDLYRTGIAIQQLVTQKDANGQTLIDKYGSTPGTFVEWYRKASGALGETDPQLRKYTALLGKIFNVEKKTFAGVAVNLNERKDLLQFMPDPGDNVRTGLQKLNTLIQSAGSELDRDIALLQQNYPATKLDAFSYLRIKQAREAQKAKETAK